MYSWRDMVTWQAKRTGNNTQGQNNGARTAAALALGAHLLRLRLRGRLDGAAKKHEVSVSNWYFTIVTP